MLYILPNEASRLHELSGIVSPIGQGSGQPPIVTGDNNLDEEKISLIRATLSCPLALISERRIRAHHFRISIASQARSLTAS